MLETKKTPSIEDYQQENTLLKQLVVNMYSSLTRSQKLQMPKRMKDFIANEIAKDLADELREENDRHGSAAASIIVA